MKTMFIHVDYIIINNSMFDFDTAKFPILEIIII